VIFHLFPDTSGVSHHPSLHRSVLKAGQMGIFAIVVINAVDAASYLIVYRFVDMVLTGGGLYLALHYNLVKFIFSEDGDGLTT